MPRIKPIKLEVGVKIKFIVDHSHENPLDDFNEGVYEGIDIKVGGGYSEGTICTCDVAFWRKVELYPDEILTKFR